MTRDDDRSAALAALRRRIDEVDDGLQDLLIRRSELVEDVARLKQGARMATFRPGREAQILRRLVGRHRGRFPLPTVVRIWREIMAAAVAMQEELPVAVCTGCWDLARDHFGSLSPLLQVPSAEEATLAVSEGRAALAVVPLADGGDGDPWWLKLVAVGEPRPAVVARLPFGALGNAAGECNDAFVIAAGAPEPSGDDCTLLVIEAGACGAAALTDAFLATRLEANPIAHHRRGGGDVHLVELGALVTESDKRLQPALAAMGRDCRANWLGFYARPLPDALLNGVAPE